MSLRNSFEVVTNIGDIARLNAQLALRLNKTFRFRETREITYPAGHQTGTVYFESSSGNAVRAWSPANQSGKLLNFVLTGEPGSSRWMEIAVQLNFPAQKYDRRMAGAFVTDANGDVFVAHRGKLTKGNAGLKKAKVFREFASQTIEAEDNGKTSTLILVSALDDPALADRLCEFGEEAREVAKRLSDEGDQPPTDVGSPPNSNEAATPRGRNALSATDRMLTLRAYFDEYAGEGVTNGHGGGKRTVEHGDVVKALEARVRANGTCQKAQAIDLAIVANIAVDLFEVKTSARTTDVYTGVGQLLIHGECINELLGLPVRRHLVLPGRPKEHHHRAISHKAGINVVIFHKDGNMYRFSGLP